jgi:hypothetical protein
VQPDFVSLMRYIAPGSLHLNGKLATDGTPIPSARGRHGDIQYRVSTFSFIFAGNTLNTCSQVRVCARCYSAKSTVSKLQPTNVEVERLSWREQQQLSMLRIE